MSKIFSDAMSFPVDTSMMMARLAAASWETIVHRTLMMAQGTCSFAEYELMATEKSAAIQDSYAALVTGQSQAVIIAPFLDRATANANRLRCARNA